MRLGWFDRMLKRRVLGALGELRFGEITVVEGDETFVLGRAEEGGLRARVEVRDPRFWRAVALGGTTGAGRAYIEGYWRSPDLPSLVRLLVRNLATTLAMEGGIARLGEMAGRLVHAVRRNTRLGSRRNIAAHYDLGNDFFALMLDETMMYSCAIFEREGMTLADASRAKNERICRKLELSPRDHLLEIGTGWGGFAIHAARRTGCRVTTTTISREQHDFAVRRVREAGLEDRVTVLSRDYRDLDGRFDKLVSIEMIEAIGHAYFDAFFAKCGSLLAPDGMMLLQGIVITDRHYDRARRTVDYIKRYVFPGCCIPSVTALCAAATRTTDLRLFHLEDITPHYVKTLRAWRENFLRRIEEVRGLGYPEEFVRLWEFYLSYCEGTFAERYIGDVQMLFTKPLNRRDPIPPRLDAPPGPPEET